MSKQIFSSPIALYVPHKRRRKNSTSHFKQPGIFRQSSFLFKVQLEIYSCVPLQRLFYDISVKSQGVISASELHSIFSTQQSNQTKYLNGDYCNISQSCWKQKHGSKIANSSISFQSCQNPWKHLHLSLMLKPIKCTMNIDLSCTQLFAGLVHRDLPQASAGILAEFLSIMVKQIKYCKLSGFHSEMVFISLVFGGGGSGISIYWYFCSPLFFIYLFIYPQKL